MAIITLLSDQYSFPAYIKDGREKSEVKINETIIESAAFNGDSWEMIEAKFLVSINDLKKYMSAPYEKGRADLQRKVITAALEVAITDRNPVLLKFLASSYLGLSETKTERTEVVEKVLDQNEINERLQKLLKKHGSKLDKK